MNQKGLINHHSWTKVQHKKPNVAILLDSAPPGAHGPPVFQSCTTSSEPPLWNIPHRHTPNPSLYNSLKTKSTLQTASCSTNIYSLRSPLSIHNQIPHGGNAGSPNRDPPCSTDTEPLTTSNPRKDYLTQMFISSLFLCLLRFQYNRTAQCGGKRSQVIEI